VSFRSEKKSALSIEYKEEDLGS